jgi:transcriptional regulator with PAS, ATPase and Fis domain
MKQSATRHRSTPDAPCHCDVCGLDTVVESIRHTTHLVAESPAMRRVLLRVRDFADADAPVMILGESGTGKEILARALHVNSPRRDRPFVAVNVAALPADLLESELFGHVRGAFTGATADKEGLFEAAGGGTLFLDEIAEMPLPLQAKLLRAVQDGEIRRVGETRSFGVDVRLVCATHRDLEAFVSTGRFREDLYYRLKVLVLDVPPLRERPEDLLPLAKVLLADERRPPSGISGDARRLLEAYDWPGNVRELGNALKHGAALARGGELMPEHLPDMARRRAPRRSSPSELRSLADVEREHVRRVLELCGGSQVDAARVLGVSRSTLWRKLRSGQP